MSYDTFQTLKYKEQYIHLKYDRVAKKEIATVQIIDYRAENYGTFFTKDCKSFRAAQIFITNWLKGIQGKTYKQWCSEQRKLK